MDIPKSNGLPKLQRKVSSKKKILLLSDDVRLKSGVGTMSREIVRATLHKYDWVQIGGALDHPDNGKGLMDLSQDFIKSGCPADSSIKVFPVAGYGDPKLVRNMIYAEKPDSIMHFTDPRFWGWLYAMEHEIRRNIPIFISEYDPFVEIHDTNNNEYSLTIGKTYDFYYENYAEDHEGGNVISYEFCII